MLEDNDTGDIFLPVARRCNVHDKPAWLRNRKQNTWYFTKLHNRPSKLSTAYNTSQHTPDIEHTDREYPLDSTTLSKSPM